MINKYYYFTIGLFKSNYYDFQSDAEFEAFSFYDKHNEKCKIYKVENGKQQLINEY